MRQRGWGRIINIASDTVNLVVPNFSHYIASKNGVIGWTRGIAPEFGKYGVTVNAIAPGLTRTENTVARKGPDGASSDGLFELIKNMQSIKRTPEPSDLAGAVSFLASDDASFITGQTLYVNGAITHCT
jgi:NAD(P)-dependent dehydrogenase (short-subunit alcohol dehydrogenase family)